MTAMYRSEFITLLSGAAAARPLAVRAQQPAMPVIGFLSFRSEADAADSVAAFPQRSRRGRICRGRNVVVEYRWADARLDRLSTLADRACRGCRATDAARRTGGDQNNSHRVRDRGGRSERRARLQSQSARRKYEFTATNAR
jgi:hypothetical protein